MTVASLIREFTGAAVIIDDAYLPAKLEMIQEEHWANLRASENADQWQIIRDEHFKTVERIVDLKRDDVALQQAWQLYAQSPEAFAIQFSRTF